MPHRLAAWKFLSRKRGLNGLLPNALMALLFILGLCLAPPAWAQRNPAATLRVTVDAGTGGYAVIGRSPAWAFRGSVGAPLQHVARTKGRDVLGPFHSVQFQWRWHGVPVTGQIKTYDLRPVARFQVTYDQATSHPQLEFPNFTSLPPALHVASYRDQPFSPVQFTAGNYGTPWLLFDDHLEAAIISPAGGFQVATLEGDGQHTAGVSLNDAIDQVPAGYSLRSLLVLDSSIGRAYQQWGRALTAIQGKSRPSNEADRSLRYLGYWTDNGAYYYYNFDKQMGYADTLLAEIQHLHSTGIPVSYLQLDSWWYPKDSLSPVGKPLKAKNPKFQTARWNVYGGIWLYEASPTLFPQGLAAFHRRVDLPLIVHGRWIGQDSPYHRTYRIAGIAPVDPNYWRHVASYLRANGVVTYEQDWNSVIRKYSGFDSNLRTGDEFFNNMAAAMKAQGLTMQYCMAVPSVFLQGSRYSNLTTIRVSDDKFIRARWYDFLFTSQLASAVGIWPWADVATSRDVNAILLQTLSAGSVGFGDAMGQENRQNLMQATRADGVLVKPDAPLVPVDSDYLNGALGRHVPTLGYTHSEVGGVRTAYVFAFARTPQDQGPVQFRASEIGLHGPMAVYDYFAHRLTIVPAGGEFRGKLENDDASYYVCASPGKSGIAFLGDRDDFVGAGRMRISAVADTPQELSATVVFAQNENSITLHGYTPFQPRVVAEGGQAGPVRYDPATREFEVNVSPNPRAPLVSPTSWEPRVREVKVIFRRP